MDTNNVADAPTHNVGQQYTYSVKGFTYMKDWAFLVFETNGKNEKCIIGNKSDYPMSEMIILKGMSVEVTYRGTKTINDNTYNQFSLDCIAF